MRQTITETRSAEYTPQLEIVEEERQNSGAQVSEVFAILDSVT